MNTDHGYLPQESSVDACDESERREHLESVFGKLAVAVMLSPHIDRYHLVDGHYPELTSLADKMDFLDALIGYARDDQDYIEDMQRLAKNCGELTAAEREDQANRRFVEPFSTLVHKGEFDHAWQRAQDVMEKDVPPWTEVSQSIAQSRSGSSPSKLLSPPAGRTLSFDQPESDHDSPRRVQTRSR